MLITIAIPVQLPVRKKAAYVSKRTNIKQGWLSSPPFLGSKTQTAAESLKHFATDGALQINIEHKI